MEESKLNSEKIWRIWKNVKLNREKILKIWKKVKLNSEKILKIQKKSKLRIMKRQGKKKGKMKCFITSCTRKTTN